MKREGTITVTSKGQATLPIAWRRSAGLMDGGSAQFELVGADTLRLVAVPKPTRRKGFGAFLLRIPPGLPKITKHYLPYKNELVH